MISVAETSIQPICMALDYVDACELAQRAMATNAELVVIDLRATRTSTTAGMARLILLRRELRLKGRDLVLRNLSQYVRDVMHILRLGSVLPCANS